jgi:hypothetical protein
MPLGAEAGVCDEQVPCSPLLLPIAMAPILRRGRGDDDPPPASASVRTVTRRMVAARRGLPPGVVCRPAWLPRRDRPFHHRLLGNTGTSPTTGACGAMPGDGVALDPVPTLESPRWLTVGCPP